MNRQKIYNTVVRKLHGKGRALGDNDECKYFPGGGHPGCAIGCQPGFRAFKDEFEEGTNIEWLLCSRSGIKAIRKFFGITKANEEADIEFLENLQRLHDDDCSWRKDTKHFRVKFLKAFCEKYDLQYSTPHVG